MQSILKILFDIIIFCAFVFTAVYLYQIYGEEVKGWFIQDEGVVIFVDDLAVSVSIADDREERQQGLSGVTSIGELEGKLFIFDQAGFHRIWMKDMNFPLDILFINDDFQIIDIVENVSPETYPLTYTSTEPARFILEVNAFFVESFKVTKGEYVTIPPQYIPADLRKNLQ